MHSYSQRLWAHLGNVSTSDVPYLRGDSRIAKASIVLAVLTFSSPGASVPDCRCSRRRLSEFGRRDWNHLPCVVCARSGHPLYPCVKRQKSNLPTAQARAKLDWPPSLDSAVAF